MIIETSVELPLSIDEAFPLLTNPSNFHFWMDGFVARKALGIKDGEVGCIASFTRKTNGLTFAFREEIVHVSPPEAFKVSLKHKDLEIHAKYELSPSQKHEDGCVLTVTQDITPLAFSMRMALGMMKSLLEKQLQGDLQRFLLFVQQHDAQK